MSYELRIKAGHIKVLSFGAKLISYIFHPLFIPIYVTYYLLYIQPYFFIGLSNADKLKKLMMIVISAGFFPAFTIFLLWRLKFVQSIQLKTQRERIIPYVAVNIFFFWVYYVSRNQVENPTPFIQFLFGVFIASAIALVANSFIKISMHAIGITGAVLFFIYLAIWSGMVLGFVISIVILLSGLVCTARLLLKEHTFYEIIWGAIIGIISQAIAISIYS